MALSSLALPAGYAGTPYYDPLHPGAMLVDITNGAAPTEGNWGDYQGAGAAESAYQKFLNALTALDGSAGLYTPWTNAAGTDASGLGQNYEVYIPTAQDLANRDAWEKQQNSVSFGDQLTHLATPFAIVGAGALAGNMAAPYISQLGAALGGAGAAGGAAGASGAIGGDLGLELAGNTGALGGAGTLNTIGGDLGAELAGNTAYGADPIENIISSYGGYNAPTAVDAYTTAGSGAAGAEGTAGEAEAAQNAAANSVDWGGGTNIGQSAATLDPASYGGQSLADLYNSVDWGNGTNIGQSPATLNPASYGPAAATAGSAGSTALQRVLGGNGTPADYAQLGLQALPGLLGAYGANQQANALSNLSSQYLAIGAPSRARYEASMAPGFDPTSIPGYSGAVDSASKAVLARLSTGGNPYGNPGGLIEANKQIINGTALPAIQNYQSQNAATGGYANFNASNPSIAQQAIGSQAGVLNSLAVGANGLINPTTAYQGSGTSDATTLANLLKKYGLGSGANNSVAMGQTASAQ